MTQRVWRARVAASGMSLSIACAAAREYGHQGDATTMTTDLLGRANSRCSMRFPRPLDTCQDVRQLALEQWCLARGVRVFGVDLLHVAHGFVELASVYIQNRHQCQDDQQRAHSSMPANPAKSIVFICF
jgi:hypothetical protein